MCRYHGFPHSGTLIAPALAAQIIADKYQDHLPHYRQSQRFRRRHGADIGRQTLNTWTHATARHLAPVNQAIKAEILQATELEIDETTKPQSTIRTPATAPSGRVASGRIATPPAAPVTSTGTPGAEPPACWKCWL